MVYESHLLTPRRYRNKAIFALAVLVGLGVFGEQVVQRLPEPPVVIRATHQPLLPPDFAFKVAPPPAVAAPAPVKVAPIVPKPAPKPQLADGMVVIINGQQIQY